MGWGRRRGCWPLGLTCRGRGLLVLPALRSAINGYNIEVRSEECCAPPAVQNYLYRVVISNNTGQAQ